MGEAIRRRIQTLDDRILQLDSLSGILFFDQGGKELITLYGAEMEAIKNAAIMECLTEIESLKRVERWDKHGNRTASTDCSYASEIAAYDEDRSSIEVDQDAIGSRFGAGCSSKPP